MQLVFKTEKFYFSFSNCKSQIGPFLSSMGEKMHRLTLTKGLGS